jgi:hypothetical protein
MSRRVQLQTLAHARAGDKGNCSNIGLFVYDPAHYQLVAQQLTPVRVAQALGGLVQGKIDRYDLPHIGGFNFVLCDALEGGVNTSLNLDGHGKSWSSLLLGIELILPDEL